MYLFKRLMIIPTMVWSLTVAAATEKDPDNDKENLSKEEITKIIEKSSNLDSKKIGNLLKLLEQKFGTDYAGKLRISGVLTSRGFNYALFKDRKMWYFDAAFIPDDTNRVVYVPNLYKTEFFNGGFKLELSYKWIHLFVPENIDIEQLDGSVFGRGVAIQNSPASILTGLPFIGPVGIEAGWMPGNNQPGNAFYIAPIVGAFGGVSFPMMKFEINPQVKK